MFLTLKSAYFILINLMPRNIEIKAHAHNFADIQARAEALSETPCEILDQEDTFFPAPQGRLKLRVLSPTAAQLIYYSRADMAGPKRADYFFYGTSDAENLKKVLALAYGVRGVVRKKRYVYQIGPAHIHLDKVESLGDFVEIEVAMRPEQTDAEGQVMAEALMEKLGIGPADLLEGAYMDIIEYGQ
jgi:predicted adenylyl cyclase CyaB